MTSFLFIFLNIGNLFGLLGSYEGQISDLQVDCSQDVIEVRCKIVEVDLLEIRDALEAGTILTFTYEVVHQKERNTWFDLQLGQQIVEKSLSFNNITGQYLARRLDGKTIPPENIFSGFEEAIDWFLTVEMRLEISAPVSEGEYLKIRTVFEKSRFLLLIPRENSTRWTRIGLDCQ